MASLFLALILPILLNGCVCVGGLIDKIFGWFQAAFFLRGFGHQLGYFSGYFSRSFYNRRFKGGAFEVEGVSCNDVVSDHLSFNIASPLIDCLSSSQCKSRS